MKIRVLSLDQIEHMKARVARARTNGLLAPVDEASLDEAYYPLAERLARSIQASARRPYFVAVVGPPGSGKTTLAAYLELMLDSGYGLQSARFGIDDVYLSRNERADLARRIHPLFAFRGAPGTHRLEWVGETVAALASASESTRTPLPRFDKLSDDSVPREAWPCFVGRPDVILFDTWLWEVEAPTAASLASPVNEREAQEDPAGEWRRAAAAALKADYLSVLTGADEWVQLEVPTFDATVRFRGEQEAHRLASLPVGERPERSLGVRYFLELFQRWMALPHSAVPDHRILIDEQHRARLDGT